MADFYLNREVWWILEMPLYWILPTCQLCIENSRIWPFSFGSNLMSFVGLFTTLLQYSSLGLLNHTWSHTEGTKSCTISHYFLVIWNQLYLINPLLPEPALCPNFLYLCMPSSYFIFKRQSSKSIRNLTLGIIGFFMQYLSLKETLVISQMWHDSFIENKMQEVPKLFNT